MTFQDTLCFIALHFLRFVIDAAIVLGIHYAYLFQAELTNKKQRIPLLPGETLKIHGERKIVLGLIQQEIWKQQRRRRAGAEWKQWFLTEVRQLTVNRFGSARELNEGMDNMETELGLGPEHTYAYVGGDSSRSTSSENLLPKQEAAEE